MHSYRFRLPRYRSAVVYLLRTPRDVRRLHTPRGFRTRVHTVAGNTPSLFAEKG